MKKTLKTGEPGNILATRKYVNEAIQEAREQSNELYWNHNEKLIPDMQDGYQVFPSGLILQWGGVDMPSGRDHWVTFPITFSDDKFRVWMTDYGAGCHVPAAVTSPGNSTGFMAFGLDAGAHNYGHTTCHWLALGR